MFNPLKYFRNRNVGLALGSGGAKGIAHISVIEYLESVDISVDMIAGSSIGAVIGALYCSGNLKRFKEDLLKKNQREMISIIDPVFPKSGLIEGSGCIELLREYIPSDLKIEDLHIPLAITATDYFYGKSVVFRSGNILEAIRASISVPGIFIPVKYRSTFLIDGGVANPLPINIIKRMGAGITIAVNLHPGIKKHKLKNLIKSEIDQMGIVVDSRDIEIIKGNDDFINSAGKRHGNWLDSIENWLGFDKDAQKIKMPNIFEIIARSFDIMELVNTRLMLKYNPPSVLIQPNILEVGTLDFSDVSRIITEGYLACTEVKGALKRRVKMWV